MLGMNEIPLTRELFILILKNQRFSEQRIDVPS